MSDNRIYQLSNEQLNVISADLIEAIVLISGKKDKTGLLDELAYFHQELETFLKNYSVINDNNDYVTSQLLNAKKELEVIVKKVATLKMQEIDIERIKLDFAKKEDIDELNQIIADTKKDWNNLIGLIEAWNITTTTKTKKVTNDLKKIDDKIIEANKVVEESKKVKLNNWIGYIASGFIGITIGIFFTLGTVYSAVGRLSFNNILMQILG